MLTVGTVIFSTLTMSISVPFYWPFHMTQQSHRSLEVACSPVCFTCVVLQRASNNSHLIQCGMQRCLKHQEKCQLKIFIFSKYFVFHFAELRGVLEERAGGRTLGLQEEQTPWVTSDSVSTQIYSEEGGGSKVTGGKESVECSPSPAFQSR